MKNFVKALDKDGQSFRFLQTKFPYVSDAKVRAGVFDGPQIRELMKYSSFDEILTGNEKQQEFLLKMFAQTSLEKDEAKITRRWLGF